MKSVLLKPNSWISSLAILVVFILTMGGCVPANHPPSIIGIEAKQDVISPMSSCLIECVVSDEDGDELSYEWSAREGKILDVNGATIAWSAPKEEGIYNIRVTVADGNGGEATGYVTIIVKNNNPPAITSLAADKDWLNPLDSCVIKCDAEDPDDDELSYEWLCSGGDISGTGGTVNWTAPDKVGLWDITVIVTDGYGGQDKRLLAVSVSQNPPPVIEGLIVTPIGHKYLKEYSGGYKVGKAKSCDIECIVSYANSELVYEWSCDGGEISGEGSIITWTAPAPDRAVKVTVTVTVSDAYGNTISKSIVFNVVQCSACTFK